MSYTIHLKGVSASFQYAASYSYICPYFTCSFWHACRQTSPVRVTTWAALACRLSLNHCSSTQPCQRHGKRDTENLWPVVNKLSTHGSRLHLQHQLSLAHTATVKAVSTEWWLLNNLHFPAKFTVPLLAAAGDWQRAGYGWKLKGDMSCKTCVNMSWVKLKGRRFLLAYSGI